MISAEQRLQAIIITSLMFTTLSLVLARSYSQAGATYVICRDQELIIFADAVVFVAELFRLLLVFGKKLIQSAAR